jgi:hypothetical protein
MKLRIVKAGAAVAASAALTALIGTHAGAAPPEGKGQGRSTAADAISRTLAGNTHRSEQGRTALNRNLERFRADPAPGRARENRASKANLGQSGLHRNPAAKGVPF